MSRYILLITVTAIILCLPGSTALAVQWKSLNGTTRYKVSYDEHSVRLTPSGRLDIWFRFIPHGDSERKSAAAEYKEKRYNSHLEYYEIDCSDYSGKLGLVDILGPSRTRLKRIQGTPQPEIILPGSILDEAAQHICPVLDENSDNSGEPNEEMHPENLVAAEAQTVSSEKQLQIDTLQKTIDANEATSETWKELGNIFFDTDQPEKAIDAYEQALKLNPDDTDILNDQGAMYRQIGNFERALINFEKAMKLSHDNLESLYNSGYVYAYDLGNIAKALVMWRKYLELDSNSETARQVQSFIERYDR